MINDSIAGRRYSARITSTVALGIAIVLFAIGGTGSNCGPTPAEQCHGCKPDQVVVCGSICVTPIPKGGACILDAPPCVSACAEGLSCAPDVDGSGRCLDFGLHNGATCPFPTTPDLCGVGTFCRDPRCASSAICPTCSPGSVCAPLREEGESCDSNFENKGCLPCDATLECDPFGTCRNKCATAGDCDTTNRCQPGRQCLREQELAPYSGEITRGTGLCYHCAALHERCNPSRPCCGQEQLCPNNGSETCCVHTAVFAGEVGGECSTVSDCCGAEFNPQANVQCAGSPGGPKTCQECTPTGQGCSDSNKCCTGHCNGGVCACSAIGDKCTASGECCTDNCDRGVCRARTDGGGGGPPPRDAGGPLTCRGPGDTCTGPGGCCAGLTCNASGHCDCGSTGTSCDVPGGSNDHGQEDALCCAGVGGCGTTAGASGRVCTACVHTGGDCTKNGCCADQGDCAFVVQSSQAKCTVLPQCVDTGQSCTYGLYPGGFIRIDCCRGQCAGDGLCH